MNGAKWSMRPVGVCFPSALGSRRADQRIGRGGRLLHPWRLRSPSRNSVPERKLGTGWGHSDSMKTCWFVVIKVHDDWWVDCEGKAYGPFSTKEDAAIDGTKLARTFGDPTRRSEVWMPDEEGKFRQIWVGPTPP